LGRFWEVEPVLEMMLAERLGGLRGKSISESDEGGITS
jgi:hypothetical protein